MAVQRRRLLVVPLLGVWIACSGDAPKPAEGSGSAHAPTVIDLDKRCERLAKICGDKQKHVDKITEECKLAAKTQANCKDKVDAVYDCYEKDLCATGDKVWALDDLRVLAERHGKCVAQQKVSSTCK